MSVSKMSSKVLHTCAVFFVLLEAVVPTTLSTQLDFSVASTLADFVNRVGSDIRMSLLSINYNSANVDPTYLNEFLVELHQCNRSYFGNRMKLVGSQKSRMILSHAMNANGLVVALVSNVTDNLLHVLTLTMRGRRYSYSIFVLQQKSGYAEIENFLKSLWSRKFRRAVVIANYKDLFTISPYPELRIVNVTLEPTKSYFYGLSERKNLLGCKVPIPVQIDVPLVFWYRQSEDAAYGLDGIGGTIFRNFMEYINASMEAYPLFINGSNSLHMLEIVKLLREGTVEISPHLHTTDNTEPEIDYSYPVIITPRCFMIPLDNEISRNLYLLLPFKLSLWALIIGQIFLMDLCFRLWLKHKNQQESVIARTGGVGLIALCLILALPSQAVKSFKACKAICPRFLRFLICYGVLAFSGAYLSQMYSSTLTSILTATLFRAPNLSEADLMEHDKPIMILKEDEIPLFGSAKFNWDYKSRLVYATHEEFHQQRLTMNLSHIYPVSLMRWTFLNEQQRFLKRKRFWLSNICAGQFPLQFQMQSDSQFSKPLMHFILRAHESGLVNYWASDTFWKATRMGHIRYLQDSDGFIDREHIKGISVMAFSPLFYLYGLGVTLSSIVFLTELAYTKVKAKLGRVVK